MALVVTHSQVEGSVPTYIITTKSAGSHDVLLRIVTGEDLFRDYADAWLARTRTRSACENTREAVREKTTSEIIG